MLFWCHLVSSETMIGIHFSKQSGPQWCHITVHLHIKNYVTAYQWRNAFPSLTYQKNQSFWWNAWGKSRWIACTWSPFYLMYYVKALSGAKEGMVGTKVSCVSGEVRSGFVHLQLVLSYIAGRCWGIAAKLAASPRWEEGFSVLVTGFCSWVCSQKWLIKLIMCKPKKLTFILLSTFFWHVYYPFSLEFGSLPV